ncbi:MULTISPECIES: hypothetical protein [Bacillaceae]|uniref:Uncharacterized protein n=1 Tax=Evansella alkalicola TaxID=745819 RepID=A0ABS6JX27_9BACI|nr:MULTISPECIES: hypothetical protein [Bacillaceae]MBU9723146.1 hypothetical protein [Bacillus alkalicola]
MSQDNKKLNEGYQPSQNFGHQPRHQNGHQPSRQTPQPPPTSAKPALKPKE